MNAVRQPPTLRALLTRACIAAVMFITIASAQEKSGEAIFKQDCMKCHGPAGEGTKKAPRPLVGEKSPAQLAAVISKTMPEDDPGTCTGNDSIKVATYLHDAFYSPDARARLNPPRIELSRLTVRQYRNSIADIVGSFGKVTKLDERHGLQAEYFDGRGFDGRGTRFSKALINRIDPQVQFDFGTAGPPLPGAPSVATPEPKPMPIVPPAEKVASAVQPGTGGPPASPPNPPAPKRVYGPPAPPSRVYGPPSPLTVAQESKPEKKGFNSKQFGITWEGSIFAPETGTYEFSIKSEHAVQLWVNDLNNKRPLIDAQVRSGGDAQQLLGSLPLLGGRWYSLRLDFSKGKELDKKKMDDPKTVSKKASIALLWKVPHGETEIIPATYLSPSRSVEVMLAETPFPPDDRSYGWERGSTISKEWNAATTEAALEAAAFVTTRLSALSGVAPDAQDRPAKIRAFARTFAERAFRRPLTDAEKKQFIDRQFDASDDLELAIKRVVLLVLKSPRFLYPAVMDSAVDGIDKRFESYAVASRLSYALWDSSPDQTLLDAAATNKLSTREELAAQAERMLASPRAHTKIREFLMTWLRTDRFAEMAKDPKRFPGFDAAVSADLRASLGLFLDDVVWSEKSDFKQLLLSDKTYLNARLAKFFNIDAPLGASDATFKRITWESDKRSGVLTHPYLLAGLSYPAESSPIHRGVFVVRGMLGMTLHPPPDAVVPIPPDLHPGMTTRDRVTMQTKPAACFQCHALVNPLGFPLENFDAVGRFRDKEHDKLIDVSGEYELRSGEIVKINGAKQLAAMLANNEQVHAAFVQQLFQYMLKQPVRAYGLTMPQELLQSFTKSGYNIRKLAVEIAVTAALAHERP